MWRCMVGDSKARKAPSRPVSGCTAPSPPGGAEAAQAPLTRPEPVDGHERRPLHPLDDQLGDPVPPVDGVVGRRVGVHQQHGQLVPVAGVDEARGVQAGHPVPESQPAAGLHEAGMARGDGQGDPRGDRRPPAPGRQGHVRPRHQVGTGVAVPGVGGQRQAVVEAHHRHRQWGAGPGGRRGLVGISRSSAYYAPSPVSAADLALMPHVLIAGSTGSGKSVAINAMIMSLLFRTTPNQVRLILVDPKRVELGMYEGIPHLFTPIITEPKLAANALRNAVREMERRLKLLASRSVRNIDQYNKLFEGSMPSLFDDGEENEPLPFIVIIIDELADLMMLDRANVEESITRLAQMTRAVGIHLILATQRPSVDVITGLIKANVPTRISFRLATKVDSRTILDTNGAEALLGRGDMLFLPPGTSRLQRLHAPFVSEKETAAVVKFWKEQGEAEYVHGFLESPKDERPNAEGGNADGEEDDPLFDDAVRLVFEFGKASTSLLQRRLRVGYGRAAHLIDLMERDGLVGAADGSRPRELLKAPNWLHEVTAVNE